MWIAGYLLNKLLSTIALLLGTSLLTFVLLRLAPGDPIAIMIENADVAVGRQQVGSEQQTRLRAELGLDQPLPLQYLSWVGRIVRLDVGVSFRSRQPVAEELARRLPATASLAGAALLVELGLALPLGMLTAARAGRTIDHVTRMLAVFLAATPSFVLGVLLLWLFAVKLRWIGVSGPATFERLILPALTLGLLSVPAVMRVLRASLLAEAQRLYIVFGRAKGLSERWLMLRHILPNALLPVITLLGINLSGLLSGAVIVETVFSWPGIGKYAVDSIYARDYPVIQGYVLLVTTIVLVVNMGVDMIYLLLDPRLRHGKGISL